MFALGGRGGRVETILTGLAVSIIPYDGCRSRREGNFTKIQSVFLQLRMKNLINPQLNLEEYWAAVYVGLILDKSTSSSWWYLDVTLFVFISRWRVMAASAVYILGVSQQCHPTDTVLNTIRPKLITLYSYRVCQPRCDMFGVQLIFWSGLFFRFLFLASSFKIVSP